MRWFTFVCLAMHSWAAAAGAGETPLALSLGPRRDFRAVYECDLRAPEVSVTRWIFFVADPPKFPWQTPDSTVVSPTATRVFDLSARRRPVWQVDLAVRKGPLEHELRARVEYRFSLAARHLVARTEQSLPATVLSAEERAASLAETELLNFRDPVFQRWLTTDRLAPSAAVHPLDYARQVFLYIKRHRSYEYNTEMDRHATYLCTAEKTDCGGMSILFCAALRHANIPARLIAGRWAKSAKPGQKLDHVENYLQQHVKAEFYVDQIGWIPVDPSSAVLHDHSAEGLRYFGHDNGDFLVLHVDPELELDVPRAGRKTYTWMQSFRYHLFCAGKFQPATAEQRWQVEPLEPAAR